MFFEFATEKAVAAFEFQDQRYRILVFLINFDSRFDFNVSKIKNTIAVIANYSCKRLDRDVEIQKNALVAGLWFRKTNDRVCNFG